MNEYIVKTTTKTRLNEKTLKLTTVTSVYVSRVTRKQTITTATQTITFYSGYRVRKDGVEMGTWKEKCLATSIDLARNSKYTKYELVTRERAHA
jgi:hypothetical protein